MRSVKLGASGLRVSRVGMGTAAFGLERYGIPTPEDGPVDAADAVRLLEAAVGGGITLFDTAPGYAPSEHLLGLALTSHPECVVATKVPVPGDYETLPRTELRRIVSASLDASRRALRREVLDVVQIHNATIPVLANGCFMECLEEAREQGKFRFLGASVYGPEVALAALCTGKIQVLQLAMSVLDQRMCSDVLPEAERAGAGILTRSALLKGALTKRARWLPESLRLVSEASARVVQGLGTTWDHLPSVALRFCLSVHGPHSMLVGIRGVQELQDCLEAEAADPLSADSMKIARSLALNDDELLNPSFWRLEESDVEAGPD